MKRRELHGERHPPSLSGHKDQSDTLSKDCKAVFPGFGWGKIVGALFVFRTVNALLCYTAFVPDEYWQALEVAHKMVFGYPTLYNIIVANDNLCSMF